MINVFNALRIAKYAVGVKKASATHVNKALALWKTTLVKYA